MKKTVIFLMAAMILASSLSGCTSSKVSGNSLYNPEVKHGDTGGLELPLTKTPEQISWFVASDKSDLNDSYVLRKMREITGVDVQLIVSPLSTASEKAKVLLASKDLPDIMGSGVSDVIAQDLAAQGAFAAVEDYLDVLPNFRKTFVENEKNNWIFKSYQAKDGKLYGFYGYDWSRDVNVGATMYRKDIFDKHGLTMWNSPEEFYTTLKKLKELYPESTPYTLKAGDSIFATLAYSWGIRAHTPYYDEADGTWKYGDTDPIYKDMLDYMKKLYDERLLDQEFLTLTQAAWTSKMTQAEKAFVTTDWIGRMEMFKEQTKDTVPDYDLRFGNPIGPKQTMRTLPQLCWARYVSKSDKSELAFKLLDFVLSPAGAELVTMGVEGETYVIGEDGKVEYLEFPGQVPPMDELLAKYGMYIEGMYLRFDRRSSYFNFTEREQEAQDFAKDPSHMDPEDPTLAFTNEEQEKINKYTADLQKAGKEFSVKYILSNETGEAAWENWKKKAESLGSKDLINIYNQAQQRFNAE